MSTKQVLESDTILGNYMLVNIGNESNILEPLTPQQNKQIKKNFVGFWRTPNYTPGVYGLKPNYLGDNLIKQNTPGK
jgi:hypothetical protein